MLTQQNGFRTNITLQWRKKHYERLLPIRHFMFNQQMWRVALENNKLIVVSKLDNWFNNNKQTYIAYPTYRHVSY